MNSTPHVSLKYEHWGKGHTGNRIYCISSNRSSVLSTGSIVPTLAIRSGEEGVEALGVIHNIPG